MDENKAVKIICLSIGAAIIIPIIALIWVLAYVVSASLLG